MSETLQTWLFASAFGLIGVSFAWQWAHRHDCESKRLQNMQDITGMRGEVKYLLDEVGRSHTEGIRRRLHKAEGRIKLLAQKAGFEVGDDD